jgi:Tfp pilus assembly protein PilX
MLGVNPLTTLSLSKHQQGVVLFIALIVLVAMTLAGIALVRSVDTTNVIAGNLAFQQSATNAGDIGAENAITWLETQNVTRSNLYTNNLESGYAAFRNDTSGFSWDALTGGSNAIVPRALGVDGAGNNVSYIIQRLCVQQGDPYDTNPSTNPQCVVPPPVASNNLGNSQTAGTVTLLNSNQQYYRITARIEGPRNTLSYTQLIIAM